jgi:HEAT repeat protein
MKGWIKMFGLGGNKFMHMAKKGDVQSLGQYASDSKVSTRLAVVNALGTVSNNTDAGNALVVYLRDPDRTVQLAAVKALGQVGVSAATTHLNRVRTQAQESQDKELEDAAVAALHDLRTRMAHE